MEVEKDLIGKNIQYDIDDPVPDDENKTELKTLLNVPQPADRKPPNLGIRERWYFKRLHDKWGENYKAMARDIKLNPNQYTKTICRRRVQIYLQYYKDLLEKIEQDKKNNNNEVERRNLAV